MIESSVSIVERPALLRAARLAAAAAIALACAACAPDTVTNRNATGFNGYLSALKKACPYLVIGSVDVGVLLDYDSMGNQNYDYFIDQTSKMYYHRIDFGSYRQSLVGFFGAGSGNDAAFNCIENQLPAQRPSAPPPPS